MKEEAHKALTDLCGAALPALRRALEAAPPPERRRRLEALVERLVSKALSSEERRVRPGIGVLARHCSDEARQVLKELAAGAAGAWTTVTAQAALKRLETGRLREDALQGSSATHQPPSREGVVARERGNGLQGW